MIKKSFDITVKNPQATLKKIHAKKRIYLILWIVCTVVSAVSLGLSRLTVVELPTLHSASVESPLSIQLYLPDIDSGTNGESHASPFVNNFSSAIGSIVNVMAVVGVIFALLTGIKSGNIMAGMMGVMISLSLVVSSTYISAFLGSDYDDEHSSVTDDVRMEKRVLDFNKYITSGNVPAYMNDVSKYSSRGGAIISYALQSGSATVDDVSNLKEALQVKEAQQITIGLAQTMAIAAFKSRRETADLKESLVAAELAARVIKATPSKDLIDIDPRTGYAIFQAAMGLKGFDLENPFTRVVTQKVKAQKAIRRFLELSFVLTLSGGVLVMFLWLTTSSYARRAANAINEGNDGNLKRQA